MASFMVPWLSDWQRLAVQEIDFLVKRKNMHTYTIILFMFDKDTNLN